jgi:hypothetical protein
MVILHNFISTYHTYGDQNTYNYLKLFKIIRGINIAIVRILKDGCVL